MMKNARTLFVRTALAVAAVTLIVCGCSSSGGSDLASLDGDWQNSASQQKVVIQLSGDSPSISIGDDIIPVSIKKAEGDMFLLHTTDKATNGQDWKLTRIWDDRGVSFSLKFQHGKATDQLKRLGS